MNGTTLNVFQNSASLRGSNHNQTVLSGPEDNQEEQPDYKDGYHLNGTPYIIRWYCNKVDNVPHELDSFNSTRPAVAMHLNDKILEKNLENEGVLENSRK